MRSHGCVATPRDRPGRPSSDPDADPRADTESRQLARDLIPDSIRGSAIMANVSSATATTTATRTVQPWSSETVTAPNATVADQPYMSRTARACEWPSSSSRWWRCCLSAANGEGAPPRTPDDREQEVQQRDGEHRDRQHERQQCRERACPVGNVALGELAGQRDRRRGQ